MPLSVIASADRHTSGMTSRLVLAYVEREAGREAVEAVLDRCRLREHEALLRDERSWFPFAIKTQLLEAGAEVLDDPAFSRKLGRAVLDFEAAAGLKAALRGLGSPRLVFELITRAGAKFTRSHRFERVELGHSHALLRYRDISGVGHHPADCQYSSGLLSAVPLLFGAPAAHVRHPRCVLRGAEACLFEIDWDETPARKRWVAAAGGAAAALGVAVASGAPRFPVAAAAPVPLLGLVVRDALHRRRARWTSLEAQLREERELSRRLSSSLQEIVADLRTEAVVTKITLNAQSIIGGTDFVLLVESDGELRVRSGTGVPAAGLEALQAWAAVATDPLEAPLAIDQLEDVPALAPLSTAGYGALHTVPLRGESERIGVLAALGHGPRSFLPRDTELLRNYATQAALALANARMVERLEALARRDALTGLLNYREFHRALTRELGRPADPDQPLSLVLVDLDRFKEVNDERGHGEGDRLLQRVAAALEAECESVGAAYRVGGDEFALLLAGTGPVAARDCARRLAKAVADVDPAIGASTGVACAPRDGRIGEALLEHADRELYDIKRLRHADRDPSGRNSCRSRPRSRDRPLF